MDIISVYINENIRKENWDYLFVLPSEYKEKGLIRKQGLLLVWDHPYKCSGSVCTLRCVPSWISSRPKYKGCLEDLSYCVLMLTDALWLCQGSATYSISLSQFCSLQHLAGYSHPGWSPVVAVGYCSGFAGFLYVSRSSLSKILFKLFLVGLHLSLLRRQHIP